VPVQLTKKSAAAIVTDRLLLRSTCQRYRAAGLRVAGVHGASSLLVRYASVEPTAALQAPTPIAAARA
jgi:hypothetical protein